jgi:hypothetical protein
MRLPVGLITPFSTLPAIVHFGHGAKIVCEISVIARDTPNNSPVTAILSIITVLIAPFGRGAGFEELPQVAGRTFPSLPQFTSLFQRNTVPEYLYPRYPRHTVQSVSRRGVITELHLGGSSGGRQE